MADPIVFSTDDPGAVSRDKWNDLAARAQTAINHADDVVQQVADDAAAAEAARQAAVEARDVTQGYAQDADNARSDAQDAAGDAIAAEGRADNSAIAADEAAARAEAAASNNTIRLWLGF